MGKLTAAIELLKAYGSIDFLIAISILSVAEKTDKHEALRHLRMRMSTGAEDCRACLQIRALLSALPDEKETGK